LIFKYKEIISTLLKPPHKRLEDDLDSLGMFLKQSNAFIQFLTKLPAAIHERFIKELQYFNVKSNKPIFIKGFLILFL